jgi:uncharacterized membrane protein YGL010W
MQAITDLFADYASYHRTRGNKWFHRFGIPLIMLSLLGLLSRVTLTMLGSLRVDLAMVVIIAAEAYYLAAEWRLGLAMLAVLIAFDFLGAAIPFWVDVALFAVGWILQFIGHIAFEKRQPAFLKNVLHLLVGPLWILNDLVPVVKV